MCVVQFSSVEFIFSLARQQHYIPYSCFVSFRKLVSYHRKYDIQMYVVEIMKEKQNNDTKQSARKFKYVGHLMFQQKAFRYELSDVSQVYTANLLLYLFCFDLFRVAISWLSIENKFIRQVICLQLYLSCQ